jgi:ketosteroid isomerase-like protein
LVACHAHCCAILRRNVSAERGDAPVVLRRPQHHRRGAGRVLSSPISGPYRGLDGLRRWREDSFEVLDDGRLLLDEVITGDDPDVIVVTNRFVGRMRHTRLIADSPLTVVVRFRDGLVVRFEGYRERAEALAAVGLGE